jgi:sec-independent protein translocase protein TatC
MLAAMARHYDDGGPYMTPGEHVEELRGCMVRALYGIGAAVIGCFLLRGHILDLLLRPLVTALEAKGLPSEVVTFRPQEAFLTVAKLSLVGGLIAASPWWIYQLWTFVAGGLYRREQRWAKMLAAFGSACFLGGVVFLYLLVLPLCLQFFIGFNETLGLPAPELDGPAAASQPASVPAAGGAPLSVPALAADPQGAPASEAEKAWLWYNTTERKVKVRLRDGRTLSLKTGRDWHVLPMYSLAEYIDLVLGLELAFGIAFLLPVAVLLLAEADLVTVEGLSRARRYVLFGAFVVGAILTPPDVISQVALALPLIVLYEVGILMARLVRRRRRKHDEQIDREYYEGDDVC